MSENVIERKITAWQELAEGIEHPSGDDTTVSAARTLKGCAKQLQAATRPEQFMPLLREWPEDAEWCSIDAQGIVCFWRFQPKKWTTSWNGGIRVGNPRRKTLDTPIGIDWRTLKVSREQMEAWEADR